MLEQNTNKVSYSEFIKPYGVGSDPTMGSMATITKVDKQRAKRMIAVRYPHLIPNSNPTLLIQSSTHSHAPHQILTSSSPHSHPILTYSCHRTSCRPVSREALLVSGARSCSSTVMAATQSHEMSCRKR